MELTQIRTFSSELFRDVKDCDKMTPTSLGLCHMTLVSLHAVAHGRRVKNVKGTKKNARSAREGDTRWPTSVLICD